VEFLNLFHLPLRVYECEYYAMRLIAILLTAALAALAQPVSLEERIHAVETSLPPPVTIKGRPVTRASVQNRMKALKVPGVSIAVINNYRIDFAKSWGLADVESNRAVNLDMLFQAASISKPVAAAAAMKLVEQGKLGLDDEVNRFLKSWTLPENQFTKAGKVTLRLILSHTAGLSVHGFPGYEQGKALPTLIQILDGTPPANTAAIRADIVPGSRYRYSGGGFTMMQLMLGDVTGKPFPALLRDLVLGKAGMDRSTYEQPLPAARASNAATAYRSDGRPVPGLYHSYPEMAAAGLWTTPSDLGRFLIEMQMSHQGRSNRVLKRATVEEMLKEQKDHYGLGFGLSETSGSKRFGHGGANAGFRAMMQATHDGKGYVAMTNSDSGDRLIQEIALSIASVYGWPDKPREREAVALPQAALERFAGRYEAPKLGPITVRVWGDHLVVAEPRLGEVEIYPASDRTFFSLGAIPDVTFDADALRFRSGGVTAKRVP
jgi:CubicO group peptidase (beta-lactamase class C family)